MLTAKEEGFCRDVALKGMTLTDAYKNNYDTKNMTDKSINELASRLANKVKIKSRINELRSKTENKAIKSAIDRQKWLTEQIDNETNNITDRLKAIDILNKMTGEYTTKIEADLQTEIIVEFDDYDEDQEV